MMISYEHRHPTTDTLHIEASPVDRNVNSTARTIPCSALAAWLASEDPPQLVAALTPWQFERDHIAGSLRFSAVSEALAQLRPGRPVVVYCSGDVCPAARYAARLLAVHGFRDVWRLAGGLEAWDTEIGTLARRSR